MGTSVLVVLSLLKLWDFHVPPYTYYKNSIVGRLEDKDRVIGVPFTLHHNLWATHITKYSG